MEVHEYLDTLRKRWLVIAVLGAVGVVIALAAAISMPSMYQSTSSVYVSSQRGETTSELVQGATFSQNLVQSFAQLVTMPKVLTPVIEELGLDMTSQQLARTITVDNRLNTVIIDVRVANQSATQAALIATAITDSLAVQVKEISPKSTNNSPSILLDTVAEANVATYPFSPNTRFLVVTGLIIGLILGVIYALGRELLDTHVRGEKDLERISDVPLIGSVPQIRAVKTSRQNKGSGESKHARDLRNSAVMMSEPKSGAAEAYRRLQTNLEFSDVDHKVTSVVVTSTFPDEGKTTIAINLALAVAEHVPRVLLIDADLRKPSVADYCQIEGAVGLTSILVGEATFDDAIQRWGGGTIDVLPAGAIPPSPNRLLGSDSMASLMTELAKSYDFIVMDSPPLAPVTDALALARMLDGAIVVSRYASTRRQQLARTLSALDAVSARVFGVVLNRVTEKVPESYYGYEADSIREVQLTEQSSPPQITSRPRVLSSFPAGVSNAHPRADRARKRPDRRRRRRSRASDRPTAQRPPQTKVRATRPAADNRAIDPLAIVDKKARALWVQWLVGRDQRREKLSRREQPSGRERVGRHSGGKAPVQHSTAANAHDPHMTVPAPLLVPMPSPAPVPVHVSPPAAPASVPVPASAPSSMPVSPPVPVPVSVPVSVPVPVSPPISVPALMPAPVPMPIPTSALATIPAPAPAAISESAPPLAPSSASESAPPLVPVPAAAAAPTPLVDTPAAAVMPDASPPPVTIPQPGEPFYIDPYDRVRHYRRSSRFAPPLQEPDPVSPQR